MIIKEQKYTNKNKLYYRGLADDDKSAKFYKETYLTTRLSYALAYSFGLNGIVEVYRLKDTANIFNMRSKTDEGNLRKFCCLNNNMGWVFKYFDKLKTNDWLAVSKKPENRKKLVDAIKQLGYDGYFNFEIDKERYEILKNKTFCNFSVLQVSSPSVAIFDINKSCERVAVYNKKEDFEKLPEIKEIKEQEKSYITTNINNFGNKNNEEIFEILRERIFTLTDKELADCIASANMMENKEKQIIEEKIYLDNIRERIIKRSKGLFY